MGMLKPFSTQQICSNGSVKCDMDESDVETIQQVEYEPEGTRVAPPFAASGA
jgi:hypothetical protein